jgi:hypothetical protein
VRESTTQWVTRSIRLFVEVSGEQYLRIMSGKLSVSVLDRFGDFIWILHGKSMEN